MVRNRGYSNRREPMIVRWYEALNNRLSIYSEKNRNNLTRTELLNQLDLVPQAFHQILLTAEEIFFVPTNVGRRCREN